MTNKLKTKLLLLFLGVLTFTFFNCEYDEKANTPENQNSKTGRYKIQRKKINDLLLDKKVSSLVKNYPTKKEVKNGLASRTIYAEDDNFYIDTEQSIYIEDTESNYSSYTFTVYRTETDSTNYLENLVLSFPDDDHYQLTLIRYELTTQEKQDLENGIDIDLSDNTITVTPIEDSDFGAELSGKIFLVQDGDCFTFIQTSCNGELNHPDGYMSDGSNCPGHHEEELWTFCNSVVIDPTPSSSGSGGGGGSGGGSSSTSNNDGGFDPDPNLDAHGGGITAPLPDLEDENEEETPCENLKELEEGGKQNIIPELNSLKLQHNNDPSKEHGVQFKHNVDLNPTVYSNIPAPSFQNSVNYTKGWYWRGGAHTHTANGYSMFSWGDVNTLAGCYDYASPVNQPYVVNIMICFNPNTNSFDTYAIKVDNYTTLQNALSIDWNNPAYSLPPTGNPAQDDENKIKLIHKNQEGKFLASNGNLELAFLKQFANYGISLYKLNSTNNKWDELTLNSTATTVTHVPCP